MTGMLIRTTCLAWLASSGIAPSETPWQPLRVCEVLDNLPASEGKVMAIVGRFSFRESGRFISEDGCERTGSGSGADPGWPNALRVVFDPKSGPPLPPKVEFDAPATYQRLKLIKQRTVLGKFRFGSVEYDRWAVVFGRIEASVAFKTGDKPAGNRKNSFDPAPAQMVCRGESAILVLAEP